MNHQLLENPIYGEVLYDLDFASTISPITSGGNASWQNLPGPDGANGVMRCVENTQATLTIPAQSTGKIRVDLWVNVTDSSTIANGARDIDVLLLNSGDSIASSNSCGGLKVCRDSTFTATVSSSTWTVQRRRNDGWRATGIPLPRNQWHHFAIVYDIDTHTYDIINQGRRWKCGEAAARSSAPSIDEWRQQGDSLGLWHWPGAFAAFGNLARVVGAIG